MKHLLAAASAAALLTACNTVPQGDPYPPSYPYPPQGEPYPYPGDPGAYPPSGPGYPPSQGYPPVGQPAPIDSCPIISSSNWRALITTGSEGFPVLALSGSVVAPTAGYRMEFRPNLEERRSYPVQMVAILQPFPPSGAAAQVQTTHDLSWRWPLASGPVGSVSVLCGNKTLAEVPVTRN